jgi:hypothetical protein
MYFLKYVNVKTYKLIYQNFDVSKFGHVLKPIGEAASITIRFHALVPLIVKRKSKYLWRNKYKYLAVQTTRYVLHAI